MNTPGFPLRCTALGCFVLFGLPTIAGAAAAQNPVGSATPPAQAVAGQPPPSDGSKPTADSKPLTANRADTPAAPNTPAKPRPVPNVSTPPSPTRTAVEEDYRIGPGDLLAISVWKEPEASVPSIIVRPDGKITLPLIKDVEVTGLTPREAEKIITSGLAEFITDANVTVIVIGTHSQKVYMIGAVKKEGPLPYTYKMTIMQALTEAGGLTDYAKRKKIYVLRAQRGKETKIPFDYDAVLKGKDMEHVWLLPNDTVVVPH